MRKLMKYLKEYSSKILLILMLLILQAYCDLSLPEYTSNIVNIGIQQGGIDQAAPKVIRKSQLENLLYFIKKEDTEIVMEQYDLVSKDNLSEEAYIKMIKKYPALGKEDLYIRNTKEKEVLQEVSSIMGKAWMPYKAISGNTEESIKLQENMKTNFPEEMKDLDIFEILGMMESGQLEAMNEKMSANFSNLPESIIIQSSISSVKAEYKAIGVDTDKLQSSYILETGAKMLGLALLSMAAAIIVCYISSVLAANMGKKFRGMVFNQVVGFSNTEFDKYSTASLITRSTNDIQQVQMFFTMLFRIVLYAPILGFGGVIKVIGTNTSMAWIIGVAVGAILLIVCVLFSITMPKFKIMQTLVDRLNLVTREILTGLPVIRAFSTEKYEEERFDKANKTLTRTSLFVNRGMTFMMPLMMLVMNVITVVIIWNGGHGVDAGKMQVGDIMAFVQYTMQIIMSFLMLTMLSMILPRASVSAGRIAEILETKSSISDPKESKKFVQSKKGYVEFKNVNFRYSEAEEDVLSELSFIAKPGETTAIIGSTGSGKSTLVNLMPRLYDVTAGEIFIDGVNIQDVSLHDLREKIGFVPQKGVLFTGTIDSNIRYGKPEASKEEIEKAARIAQAVEFITGKPEGYGAEISQGGSNVSGGQKQRLAIARAIAKDPEIYIFDDSFSALDYKTDSVLRKTLKEELSDRTIIIVAQRISTILNAEQIIVLDDGKIVGKGTHKELLANCEVYNQIASSQLSKEELEQ